MSALYSVAKAQGEKILLFSNRVAVKGQQAIGIQGKEDTIDLVTYQKIEYRKKGSEDFLVLLEYGDCFKRAEVYISTFKYIVCDEAHYFVSDTDFNSYTDTLIEVIKKIKQNHIVIMATATSECLQPYLEEVFGKNEIIPLYQGAVDYSRIDKAYWYDQIYNSLDYLPENDPVLDIIDSIPQNEKIVCFMSSKDRMKKLCRWYNEKRLGGAVYISSDEKNTKQFKNILESCKFEEHILISTKVVDNGVNLIDKNIKHIILEQPDWIEFKQCLGRRRFDYLDEADKVTLYFSNMRKTISIKTAELSKALDVYNDFLNCKIEIDGHILFDKEDFWYKYRRKALPKFIENGTGKVIEPILFKTQYDYEFYSQFKKENNKQFQDFIAEKTGLKVKHWYSPTLIERMETFLKNNCEKKFYGETEKSSIAHVLGLSERAQPKTINSYLNDLGVPYVIRNERDTTRADRKRYWIIKKNVDK